MVVILLSYTAYLSLIKYHCSPRNKWNVQQLLQTHTVFRIFFSSSFFLSVTCKWPEHVVVGIVLTAVVQGCRWMKQMSGEEGRRWGGGEEKRREESDGQWLSEEWLQGSKCSLRYLFPPGGSPLSPPDFLFPLLFSPAPLPSSYYWRFLSILSICC